MAICSKSSHQTFGEKQSTSRSGDGVEETQMNALVAEADVSFVELNHLQAVMK